MTPLLGLAAVESPLDDAWRARAIASFSATERERLARIERPHRRAQFIASHQMLRWLLAITGRSAVSIEVGTDGAPRLDCLPSLYASIAHSQHALAVVVADEPVGVDLEPSRVLGNSLATASLLCNTAEIRDTEDVLRAWVLGEARLKAGTHARDGALTARWEDCQLALAGLVTPPLTRVFEMVTGTYNPVELRWASIIAVREPEP